METLLRIGRYFRSPLVVCGTYNSTQVTPPSFEDFEVMRLPIYLFFARNWDIISNARRILPSAKTLSESSLNQWSVLSDVSMVDRCQREYSSLSLPTLGDEQVHKFTPNIEKLLSESKSTVLSVLEGESLEDQGWSRSCSASGDGFTCTVFRKEVPDLLPMYVISGDLDISADMFHALVCDVDFRHEWDDQFHHVGASAVEGQIRLLEWVVKWPWPLAPREYRYLQTPHVFSNDSIKLVMSASVHTERPVSSKTVAVREYFGITAAKPVGPSQCRFCVFHFDDPRLPGKMPAWLETHVAQSLLPSFPKKIFEGAKKYPQHRLVSFSNYSHH